MIRTILCACWIMAAIVSAALIFSWAIDRYYRR